MALLVSTCYTEARALLNDAANTTYTDAVLLPFFIRAYKQLEQRLRRSGIQVVNEVSATISVGIGVLTLTLPTDFAIPISLFERAVGGTDDDWQPMAERTFEPLEVQSSTLEVWAFRENAIVFRGSTAAREVKLLYKKFLPTIASGADNVLFLDAQPFLASVTAAYAALFIAENVSRYEALMDQALSDLSDIEGIAIKERQNLAARRRSYRPASQRGGISRTRVGVS
jgi:hypothetical protein